MNWTDRQLIILLFAVIAATHAKEEPESTLLSKLVPKVALPEYTLTPNNNQYEINLQLPDGSVRSETVKLEAEPASGLQSLLLNGKTRIIYPESGGYADWIYTAGPNGYRVRVSYSNTPPIPEGGLAASASFLKSATG